MAMNAISFPASSPIHQACAVPFRTVAQRIEFCLITASSGRWLFPKGCVEPGDTFAEAALKEALEEAGLHGRVIGEPIGCYEFEKKGQPRTAIVFLMEVSKSDKVWKEVDVRQRRWATAEEAFRLVSQPQLLQLLCAADTRLRAA